MGKSAHHIQSTMNKEGSNHIQQSCGFGHIHLYSVLSWNGKGKAYVDKMKEGRKKKVRKWMKEEKKNWEKKEKKGKKKSLTY